MRKMLLIIGLSLLAIWVYRKFFKKNPYAIAKSDLSVDTVEPKVVNENKAIKQEDKVN